MNFKKGDRVRDIENGQTEVVESVPGMESYDDMGFADAEKGFMLSNGSWKYQKYWKKVNPVGRPKGKKKPTIKKYPYIATQVNLDQKKELILLRYKANEITLKKALEELS